VHNKAPGRELDYILAVYQWSRFVGEDPKTFFEERDGYFYCGVGFFIRKIFGGYIIREAYVSRIYLNSLDYTVWDVY
jgi:hypothetical protein